MTRAGSVSAALRSALRPKTPRCYRHCQEPVRAHSVSTPFPGYWSVYACPGGVVSVTSYVERSRKDPTLKVRRFLSRRSVPPSLVTRHDLRTATRHGPELGVMAERILARDQSTRPLKVVYWRVYPFQGRDGSEQRLFVCFRHGRARPVFYADSGAARRGTCPVCAAETLSKPRRQR